MYLKQKNETRMTPCTGTSSVLVANRAEGETLGNVSMFQVGFQIQKLNVYGLNLRGLLSEGHRSTSRAAECGSSERSMLHTYTTTFV